MFQESPWFGQGYDSFGFRIPLFSNLPLSSPGTPLDPHNMYLEFLATSGLLGFLAFLFFLGSIFRLVWERLAVSPWFVTSLGVLISFCVGGFFDRYFDMPHTLVPVFLLLGLCTSLSQKTPVAE
jgi:O-antigen ligase